MSRNKASYFFIIIVYIFVNGCGKEDVEIVENLEEKDFVDTLDMLTPAYYQFDTDPSFIANTNQFISFAQQEEFYHPLENEWGEIPDYTIPVSGEFGAGKGPTGTEQHHPAVDFHVGDREMEVDLYAAFGGYVTTSKDSDKYRHYISLAKDVVDDDGHSIGKIVTLYAHIDLDLDEQESIDMNEKFVEKGELISKNLYSGTVGGPHLHFEIRYYRFGELGDEVFYGFKSKESPNLTEASAGNWLYGVWDPNVGYGFGNPLSHGLEL